ncbi:MAG: hypothetical protein KDA57_15880 [Planctomycetales bacterium]|nr:hypothetical protein [Planctomycetales bacterium]
MDISGGVVSSLAVTSGSEVSVSGGAIPGDLRIEKEGNAVITGGTIYNLYVMDGGAATVQGGTIERNVRTQDGGELNLTGGIFEYFVTAESGSTIDISGGSFGSNLHAAAGSIVSIKGSDFLLDGVPVSGLVPGEPFEITYADSDSIISGVLADGTPFEFEYDLNCRGRCERGIDVGATLFLVQIPEPQSFVLAITALCLVTRRHRY